MRPRLSLVMAILLVAGGPLAGCLSQEPGSSGPTVVATTYPAAFLAKSIGGDNVTVRTLVDAGQGPHGWSPTVGDVQAIQEADLIVAQGAGLEPWLEDLVARAGDDAPPVVRTSQGLALIEGTGHAHHAEEEENHADEEEQGDEDVDPHTWMDPVRYAEQARRLTDAMVETFPRHTVAFEARMAALDATLSSLDHAYAQALDECEIPFVIVNHNAFSYLADRYGFGVEAVFGVSEEAEAPPGRVRELIDLAEEHNVSLVLQEALSSPRTLERIADEAGAEIATLHPIGGLTPDEAAAGLTYVSLMEANLAPLQEAMACS